MRSDVHVHTIYTAVCLSVSLCKCDINEVFDEYLATSLLQALGADIQIDTYLIIKGQENCIDCGLNRV